jgi:hypothetical protein
MSKKQKAEIDDFEVQRYVAIESSRSEVRNRNMKTASGLPFDEQGIKTRLMEMQGNEHGKFWNPSSNSWEPALILAAEQLEKDLQAEFTAYREKVINEGKRAPEVPPDDLRERMVRNQAKLIVLREDLDDLKTELVKVQARTKTKDEYPLFPHGGPMGMGKLGGPTEKSPYGVLVRIDGQTVKPDVNGVLCIADPRSRYNGMATADYIEFVVKPWRNDSARLVDQMRAEWLKDHPHDPLPANPQAPWPEWPSNVPKPE